MTRPAGFRIGFTLECVCGARFEGSVWTHRLRATIRAFSKAHHHPPKRDALGRFVSWQS